MQGRHRGIREITEIPPPLELTSQEIAALAEELVQSHAALADLYYRVAQAHWGEKYLQGLLLPIARKSIEPLALALAGGNVQAMQQFIGQGQWQDTPLLHKHWPLVDAPLGEADGVCIVDGWDCPKQGAHSVGGARQWCGRVGKVAHCQAGGVTAYASRKGEPLLDRRLYLPEAWFAAAHRARWRQCGLPAETPFQTKPALALEMWQALVREGRLRWRWVTCDGACGRDGAFLDGTAALGRWYFAEVPHDTQAWAASASDGRAGLDGPRPPASQGPSGSRSPCAAARRPTRHRRASGRMADLPEQRGEQRTTGGGVCLPARGGRAEWPAWARRVDGVSAYPGRESRAQGLSQQCPGAHARSHLSPARRHALADRDGF
jgi:hypothetical protein